MNETCPTCHQRIAVERLGIRLPPFKARVIDIIKAAGDLGISSAELTFEVYRGYSKMRRATSIKAHVWQINELLVETDWRIVAEPRAGSTARWYLQRRRRRITREAAE